MKDLLNTNAEEKTFEVIRMSFDAQAGEDPLDDELQSSESSSIVSRQDHSVLDLSGDVFIVVSEFL